MSAICTGKFIKKYGVFKQKIKKSPKHSKQNENPIFVYIFSLKIVWTISIFLKNQLLKESLYFLIFYRDAITPTISLKPEQQGSSMSNDKLFQHSAATLQF